MNQLSSDLIEEAAAYLKDKIRNTPLEPSEKLSQIFGGPVFLKLENLQLTGSFKIRGAFFRLSKLTEKEKAKGVITCSAGNHGKAVSYVAKLLKIPATIFVPKNVDQSKFDAMEMLGAEVIVSPHNGYADTALMAKEASQKSGKPYVSAYDDFYIMAGNGGSLGKEILETLPEAKTFVVPVGGGGLSAGLSYYVKEKNPQAEIISCMLKDSPALVLSLEKGEAVTSLPSINTVAGGLEGGLGARPFDILKSRVDQCSLASEEEIYQAFRWGLENHQYLIEPSGVVTIACAITKKITINKFPAVFVISGRNVSLQTIKRILETTD
jgi:threonine dehydratase